LTGAAGAGRSPLTVVMITRNRCASAVRSVREIRALPERPPVIVVDNGSSDDTVRELSRLPAVHVIEAGRNLAAAGRNLGAEQARTPYVAFADDDSWWAPGALDVAVKQLDSHPRLGVLVARTLVGAAETDDPMNASLAAAPLGRDADLPGPTALGFLACAAVVHRRAFLTAGGFHPRFGVGGEEQLLALDLLAAGWGLAYVPEVVAHHHPAPGPERAGRQVHMARNELWTMWLRRRRRAVAALGAAPTASGVRADRAHGAPLGPDRTALEVISPRPGTPGPGTPRGPFRHASCALINNP
jgi:GT2 family glycosyltransferase